MEKSLWFVLARKPVSTTKNEAFVEKNVSTKHKNCFFFFPLAGKYFSVKIGSP